MDIAKIDAGFADLETLSRQCQSGVHPECPRRHACPARQTNNSGQIGRRGHQFRRYPVDRIERLQARPGLDFELAHVAANLESVLPLDWCEAGLDLGRTDDYRREPERPGRSRYLFRCQGQPQVHLPRLERVVQIAFG